VVASARVTSDGKCSVCGAKLAIKRARSQCSTTPIHPGILTKKRSSSRSRIARAKRKKGGSCGLQNVPNMKTDTNISGTSIAAPVQNVYAEFRLSTHADCNTEDT
jgi:hypothetical protein